MSALELIGPGAAPYVSLLIVAGMFILFVREAYPTEVTALGGVALLLALGILPQEKALDVFSNPAPWTIAAMFVLSGALLRTGVLESFTDGMNARAKSHPVMTIFTIGMIVAVASAFMNNTPVVVVMMPIVIQLARSVDLPASKLLIPLSYIAILGGTTTLIGTSTNLLVDGVARDAGLDGFSLFEITPLGVVLVVCGFLYLRILGPFLLPERGSMADLLGGDRAARRFFTDVVIPPSSALIGARVLDVDLFKLKGVRIVDVIRGDLSLRRAMDQAVLQDGDRVVLRTSMLDLLELRQSADVISAASESGRETKTVETLITPDCRMIGRTLGAMRLRRRYGVYPLALHRRNQNFARQLDQTVVRLGDTILLEGTSEDLARLAQDMNLVSLTEPVERAYRRKHAPIVIAALLGVILLSALEVAPILPLAIIAMGVVLLTRCIDADEAFAAVDGRLLVLIFSMLSIGAALDHSGAVTMIAQKVAPLLSGLPPFFIIWAIYLMTSVMTEMISNNAVAVVVTPIAISLAMSLGLDPRPFVVAVMVAASASFATPIGYQTNTLIYGPGGYAFSDFLKIGIPLNLSIGLISSALIPILWPL